MISLIDAGPGTGKTFSLIYGYLTLSQQLTRSVEPTEEQQQIFDYLQENFHKDSSVCFFAHGREVKKKLEGGLKNTKAKVHTLHGAGYSVLKKRFGYQKRVNNRTENHIKLLTGYSIQEMKWEERRQWMGVKRVVHYLKTEAMEATDENLAYLILKYNDLSNYSLPDDCIDKAADLLEKASLPDGTVEFADMPWMAKKHIRGPIYDLGFVDESQDVANSTYQLLTRLCKNIIFCGDKNQAINAFAGASEEMYEKIKGRCDAVLPLKMTQRCPPDICNLANEVRPGGVVPGPNTHKAIIKDISKFSLPEILIGAINPANTLLLSRTNANVVNLAIYFHTKQIPFCIIDKELGEELARFIKMFSVTSIPALKGKLNNWLTRMERCPNPFFVQACTDKYQVIQTILSQCNDYNSIFKFLKTAFEETAAGFKITTCHKAKGLEAQNIFIINPPIPLPFAMEHPIAKEQELNLDFVAKTRSSQDMYMINS